MLLNRRVAMGLMSGVNTSIPKGIDFSKYFDGALPSPFVGGSGWRISSGKLINTPDESGELLSNGDMETGDPQSSWGRVGTASWTSVSDERTGGSGSKAVEVTSPTAFQTIRQQVSLLANSWYRLSYWFKKGTAVSGYVVAPGNLATSPQSSNISWDNLIVVGRNTTSNPYFNFGSAGSGTSRYDDVSVKSLSGVHAGFSVPVSLLTVKAVVGMTNPSYSPIGIFVCGNSSNPTNGIFATIKFYSVGFVSVKLWKLVNNVFTELSSTNMGYVEGAFLEIRRLSTSEFQVWYHATQCGTTQTVSDALIISNTFVGILNPGIGFVSSFYVSETNIKSIVWNGTSITSGGGTTYANGYVQRTIPWLDTQAPYYSFINRINDGIGGTNSWYALVRMATSIVVYNPDVVVIEQTPNDLDNDDYKKLEEAFIRRLRSELPNARLCYVSNLRVNNIDVNDASNVDIGKRNNWKTISDHYGIPFYDMHTEVAAAIARGDSLNTYMYDTVHPSAEGHRLLHEGSRDMILRLLSSGPMIGIPSRLYDSADFENTSIIRNATNNDGTTGIWTQSGTTLISSTANSTISWTGTFNSCGPDRVASGVIQWAIDGGPYSANYNLAVNGNFNPFILNLARGTHTFTLKIISGTITINRFLAI